MSKRKPKGKKCVYFDYCGNMTKKRSSEHAFPKQLMPKNSDGITINGVICPTCNTKFGKWEDQAWKQSYVGVHHNDFEVWAGRGDSSIYNQVRDERTPVREFAVYSHAIVMVEPKQFIDNAKVLAHRNAEPMPMQLILAKVNNKSSNKDLTPAYKDVLEMASKNPAYDNLCEDDVYRLHADYWVFGPVATKKYYSNPDRFIEKYLIPTDESEAFLLLAIPPSSEETLGKDLEREFLNAISEKTGSVFGEYYQDSERNVQSISGRLVGTTDYRRAVAKTAFHCFLYLCEERRKGEEKRSNVLTGREEIFKEIREYIYKEEYSRSSPVTEMPAHVSLGFQSVVKNTRTTDCMVKHLLVFYMNDKNIVCVIEFYGGTKVNSIFSVDLARSGQDFLATQYALLEIPYMMVSPNHPYLPRIYYPTDGHVDMAKNGEFQSLAKPSKISYQQNGLWVPLLSRKRL